MILDIDAARAARLEAAGEPHELVVGGTTYTVPVEAPWMFVDHLAYGRLVSAIEEVIGKTAWKKVAKGLSHRDVMEIVNQLAAVWGLGSGPEQSASTGS